MARALVLLLLGPAWAQSALAPIQEHPLARQAQSLVQAALKALEAQRSPLALNLQGNYGRLGYDCTPPGLCQNLPESTASLTLSLVLTPFPFGEVADGLERAQIALGQAQLGYRRALAALQAQAVAAYGRHQEALLAEKVALKGVELAQAALEAAKRRQANPRELREAELSLKEAETRLEEARRGVLLARRAAEGLVDLEAPLPPVPVPDGGTYLQVEEAQLGLLEARIAYGSALRGLLPQLQASYLLYPSGSDALALSLSSRTLQPTLSYTRLDPPRPPTQVPGVGSYRTTEELRLSLALTLSPGLLAGLEAAEARLRGAEAALRAAEDQAKLQEETLRNALQGAEAALALARLRLEAEKRALEEAQRRLELGLESGLGLLRAELSLLQAELGVLQAQNNLRNRVMELYGLYGKLLEVNP
ncbi:TolC family protein [Thermus sediminis]|uniref:TolC family protein n=1 Tax=Thermus sediminis TaxID=1761908 RepID=UPI000E3E9CA4|nr:TolC family protein [Thermus sediminis]